MSDLLLKELSIMNKQFDLYKGDCLEMMKHIPDGSVDMVMTDPPYGTTCCKWDSVIPLEPMWEQLKRIIKPNGAIVMTAQQPFASFLISSNLPMYKYEIIWVKNRSAGFLNAKLKPLTSHENVYVFSEGKTSNGNKNNMPYFPQGLQDFNKMTKSGNKPDKENTCYRKNSLPSANGGYLQKKTGYPKTVIYFDCVNKAIHPTQKPVALMEYLIKTYTNEGEIVLDFTMGSGTTGVACVNLNRDFIGIEQDDKYFEVATVRIEEAIKTMEATK